MKGHGYESDRKGYGSAMIDPSPPHPFRSEDCARYSSIRNILLVSTPYDLFLLEEEGRLTDHFRERYIESGSRFIPLIEHAASGREALEMIEKRSYDIVVPFNPPWDMDLEEFTSTIKDLSPGTNVALLASNTPEIRRIMQNMDGDMLDMVMTWSGDGTILETIVRLVEDLSRNRLADPLLNPAEILVIGDDIGAISSMVEQIYGSIHEAFLQILGPDPSLKRRRRIFSRLPRPVIIRRFEDIDRVLNDPDRRIIGTVVQISGLDECSSQGILDRLKAFPSLMISDDDEFDLVDYDGIRFVTKRRNNIDRELNEFISVLVLPGDLSRIMSDGSGDAIKDLRSLMDIIATLEEDNVLGLFKGSDLVTWLHSICEFEMASWLSRHSSGGGEIKAGPFLDMIKEVRSFDRKGSILDYTRDKVPADVSVMRIGKGPMGGKARGLAFMDRFICSSDDADFNGIEVRIPSMVIICTDLFARFMDENKLLDDALIDMSDERIAEKFLSADLPSTLSGDLRSVIRSMRGPLSIRSSSLLEDAIFQPFAGVYASLMVPNTDSSEDARFNELARAVKYIYASTYFKEARDYIRTTSNRIEEERMGVIIQSVSGRKYGDLFYPTISGVARSEDYWPLPGCGREEGTVSIALGLGKVIVDGMGGWKFCPSRPAISLFNDAKELMDSTQRKFYGIFLGSRVPGTHPKETSTLRIEGLETALNDGTADLLVSTFDASSDRFYPGPFREGPKVMDFSPILKERTLPLPQVVKCLLEIGKKALGGPVEIEFTVNIDQKDRRMALDLLQIRSMVARWGSGEIDIEPEEGETVVMRSSKVLGHGISSDCRDLIFVTDPDLDLSSSNEVSREVSRMNTLMIDSKRPYILVGPGRWGSSDPWMGIPVNWSDVSGAQTIVETPVGGRMIDPSQGSHFFQNLSSLRRSYFTLSVAESEDMNRDLIKNSGKLLEGRFLTHVELDRPLKTRIDGKHGKGTISIGQRSTDK